MNVEVNLQMTVGICKCRSGFTNTSILFRKCLYFYSSPLPYSGLFRGRKFSRMAGISVFRE